MQQFRFVILLLLLFAVIYSCHRSLLKPETEPYPTIVKPVSQEKLLQLQKKFDDLNDHKIATLLNRFGFTGEPRPFFGKYPNNKLESKDALEIALNTVIKNAQFTNVNDKDVLLSCLQGPPQINGEGTRLIFSFGPQSYKGYMVPTTEIRVTIHGGIPERIRGFWYPNIVIPTDRLISKEMAIDKVMGQPFGKSDWSEQLIVNEVAILQEKIGHFIYRLRKQDSFELRVVWSIPIGSPIPGTRRITLWIFIVDAVTNEIVESFSPLKS